MASYLMVFRGGEVDARNWNSDETKAYYRKWGDWGESFRDRGVWIAGHPLQDEG